MKEKCKENAWRIHSATKINWNPFLNVNDELYEKCCRINQFEMNECQPFGSSCIHCKKVLTLIYLFSFHLWFSLDQSQILQNCFSESRMPTNIIRNF